jgi:hypothetical protein
MANKIDWDRDGPQTVADEFGPEPSLRILIRNYYLKTGIFSLAEVEKYTQEYIDGYERESEASGPVLN